MRILFIGVVDWANVANRVAAGMNAAAGKTVARVFTWEPHPYRYQEDCFSSADELRDWAAQTTWVISAGDGDYLHFRKVLKRLRFAPDARYATVHVGSAYRARPDRYNEVDAQMFFSVRFIGGDLYRFAADDPTAVPFFAPPHAVLHEVPVLDGPVRVCHTPSTPHTKGTELIKKAVPDVRIVTGLSFQECAAQRGYHHIFVDQINDLGGYGAAAVEGLSFGCAVVGSTALMHSRVSEFYALPPIVSATRDDVGRVVSELRRDPVALEERRSASLAWARQYATPQAVGNYWLDQLNKTR